MEERHRIMIDKLIKKLKLETMEFLNKNLEDEEEVDIIIGIMISSHISSLINLLTSIGEHHPVNKEKLDKFCKNIIKFLESQSHKTMEVKDE
jgi:hypothetical protein